MNQKQGLKKHIKELEEQVKSLQKMNDDLQDYNGKAKADITAYNACITGVICGKCTYCDWCEEAEECQLEAKGKGCALWWLKYGHGMTGGEEDDGQGLHVTGAEG